MKKKILLIATGGTISCEKSEDGLAPLLTGQEIIDFCPLVKEICDVTCIQPMNIDSSNMRVAHWLIIENIIEDNYDSYDGFVITHGTDTMAYSASALSYLIQNNKKPIILTGAQKSINEPGTDAIKNLTDAFLVACDDMSSGTMVVFSGSVIVGTRARKNYSKSFQAFGSINYPEIAKVQDNVVLRYIEDNIDGNVKFYDYLNANVGLIKFVPSFRNDVLRYIIEKHDGIIIESFGVGGMPEYLDFYDTIKKSIVNNKLVVLTTQVSNEGSNLSLYKVGAGVKKDLDILEAYDMTTESAFTKLMWILANSNDFEKSKDLFYKTINHDIIIKP